MQSACLGGSHSPGLLGLEDLLLLWLSHVAGEKRPQFLTGFWQEISVPHLVGLYIGSPECPHDMAAGFPRGRVILERARRKFYALYDLQKLLHFCHILFVKSESLSIVHMQEEWN